MLTEMRALTERSLSDAWTPVTGDATELDAVRRMASWLSPRLDRLGDAPAQLVHGDWATPNLLFERRDGDRVIAVLDWQCCALGPVIADVAQAVAGVLMWSRLPVDPTVDAMFAAYGAGAERRLLGPALAAHWLRNYWWLRAELARDSRRRAAMDRQPARLRAVLAYVTNLRD